MVAIQVYDERETSMPAVGLMKTRDAETGREIYIDTASRRVRDSYRQWWERRQEEMLDTFRRSRVDSVSIRTDEDYVKALIGLFKNR
jgi:uncharacterized protein (DUF58 family)